MIEHLKFLEVILGSYDAAAKYLGYSVRQYYNIRRSILEGKSLKPRVKTLIVSKVSRLKPKDFKETRYMSKPDIPRLGRNAGRIEFIAAQKQIQSLIEAGFDRKKIHAVLAEKGQITMSYATFCYQYKKFNATAPEPARLGGGFRVESRQKAPAPGFSGRVNVPAGRIAKTEPFSVDKSKTLEDLV